MIRLPENIAHFANGMAFMFFVLLSIRLYEYRNHNRLMRFFFWEMLFFSFIELSNMIYLIDGIWDNDYISNISLIFDSLTVPVSMIFMFEIISPGWVTLRKMIFLLSPSILFLIFYIIFPSWTLFYANTIYSNILGIITVVIVFLASSKYDNYIKKNFSYTENMSLSWLRWIITPLYLTLFVWTFIIWQPSWLGDAFYYLFTVIIWMFIYHFLWKHVIIDVPELLNPFSKTKEEDLIISVGDMMDYDNNHPFAQKLNNCMENDRLFLNPKLSIADLAAVVGTNRTYLSDYLNKQLHTTFYEYVNTFRVKKACELLDTGDNINLEIIAESCGFNSLSTFRRSFLKEIGTTPLQYKKSIRN